MTYECNFNQAILAKLLPQSVDAGLWFAALDLSFPSNQIISRNRIAAFLSQTFVETSKFTVLQENLNYSAHNLVVVFHDIFNSATANVAAHNPQVIANNAYANRMGNGTVDSGDGWQFRGRGLLQITGRYMYTQCSHDLWGDDRLVQNPDLLLDPNLAVSSACWFWASHGLNALADVNDIVAITKKITGGNQALDQRLALYRTILPALA